MPLRSVAKWLRLKSLISSILGCRPGSQVAQCSAVPNALSHCLLPSCWYDRAQDFVQLSHSFTLCPRSFVKIISRPPIIVRALHKAGGLNVARRLAQHKAHCSIALCIHFEHGLTPSRFVLVPCFFFGFLFLFAIKSRSSRRGIVSASSRITTGCCCTLLLLAESSSSLRVRLSSLFTTLAGSFWALWCASSCFL